MGSHGQDDKHSLALNYQLNLPTPLAQTALPSSSQETELENNETPEESGPASLEDVAKEPSSGDTSCTVSGGPTSEGEIENVVRGMPVENHGPLWKQPVVQLAKKNPDKQAESKDSGKQRNGVRSLKIRLSLGPKFCMKKQEGPAEVPSLLFVNDQRLSNPSKEETVPQARNYIHQDAQESINKNWRDGDSSCTDTDEDGELIQRAMKAKEDLLKRQQEIRVSKPRRPSCIRPRPGGVTLKLLIDEGLIKPGPAVLSLEYRGLQEAGDLLVDGRIQWKDKMFDSPSAFSIFVKRMVNPTRKADDGWKTVKHAGKYLDHYKLELARKRFGPVPDGLGADNSDIDVDNLAKRARLEPCDVLRTSAIEATNSGDGEINSSSINHQFSNPQCTIGQVESTSSQCQNAENINQGNDEGLQGSDSLIHTKVFPGEASLIHSSLLGI